MDLVLPNGYEDTLQLQELGQDNRWTLYRYSLYDCVYSPTFVKVLLLLLLLLHCPKGAFSKSNWILFFL